MKINSLYEKGSGAVNEDQMLLGKAIFAVFDGATSLNNFTDPYGHTGGVLASTIARHVFEKEDKDLFSLATEASECIAAQMDVESINTSDKGNRWTTTVAAIALKDDAFDWLTVGDSVIIAIDTQNNFEIMGTFHDQDVETLRLWKQYASQQVENIREKISDVIVANRRQMNILYGGLNGEPEFTNFAQQGTRSLQNITHLILATDGLFIPTEDPAQEDWALFVSLYLKGGLKKVKEEVLKRQNSDPYMWQYPRFKPTDDMSAIALQL